MDRAEAKHRLQWLRATADTKRNREALGLAIEALSEPKIMRCKGCNYFLGADEDTFCGLCSREDTQGDAESATTNLYDVQLAKDLLGISEEAEKHQLSGETPTNTPTCNHTCNKKQVTGKLKNPDDSLLTEDSEACKEQKSKLDCISRQQAIEAVANHFMTDALIRNPSASNDIEDWKKIAESVLSKIPPVTPTERTGEWIPKVGHKDEIYTMPLICSECGAEIITDHDNYCGHCGAKMGGDTP